VTEKKIKILIKADSRYPVNRKRLRRKVAAVLGSRGLAEDVEVSFSFVGNRKMKSLNSQYRGEEQTTDVLSFPLIDSSVSFPENETLRLGDVVISYPQARKQAQEHNRLVDEEIDRLAEHGVLSLLGIHEN